MKKSISEITAKNIMTPEIVSVDKNDTLELVIPLLISKGIHHVAVFDGKEFAGFFGYKQLARLHRRPVHQTRVGEHIIKPPAFNLRSNVVDIAESMYRLNYKIAPIIENKKLIGVVSETDIIKAAINTAEINSKKIGEFMTPEPITVKDTDRLGAAISKLRDMNISRLPVVSKSGEIVGIFESMDVMRERYTKGASYGIDMTLPTNPQKGSITVDAYIADEIPDYKIAVKALMKFQPIIARTGDNVVPVFEELIRRNMTSVIVADERNSPIGIVVPKDIVYYIARMKQESVAYIQISGLEPEVMVTDFQKEEVHRMIDEAVRKLVKIMNLQFFTIHFKAYHTEGKRKKFTVRCRVDTDNGLYVVREYGWDAIDVTSKLLAATEDLLISEKQKMRTKLINRDRYGKWLKNERATE